MNKQIITNSNELQTELIGFCRLLSIACKSKLPLAIALENYTNNRSKTLVSNWTNELVKKLSEGYTIEEATEYLSGLDPLLARLLPLIGDDRLLEVFDIYTRFLIKQNLCQKQIKYLIQYPLIILILCLLVIIFLNIYTFPNMQSLSEFNGFWDVWSLNLLYIADIKFWPLSLIIPLTLVWLIIDCIYIIITGRFGRFSIWGKTTGLTTIYKMNELSRLAAMISLYLKAGFDLNQTIDYLKKFFDSSSKQKLEKFSMGLKSGYEIKDCLSDDNFIAEIINGNEKDTEELAEKLNNIQKNINEDALKRLMVIADRVLLFSIFIAGLTVLLVSLGYFGSYMLFARSLI